MSKRIITVIVLVGLALSVIYTFTNNRPAQESYAESILKKRKETDTSFKNDKDSPLTTEQKKVFTALSYYDISEKYAVTADFSINDKQQIIKMAITDGSQREYYIYGTTSFTLENKELKLTVFKPVDLKKEYFFIPFYDKTSGDTSYGGGRYVEPELLTSGKMEIDFNLSYNPYCAYNHTYRCPIPPAENNLNVAITAGEKIPGFVK